jgi:type IV secretory pathway VirB2 component (pilin)
MRQLPKPCKKASSERRCRSVKRFLFPVIVWALIVTVFLLAVAPLAFAAGEEAPFSDFINKLINIGRTIAGTLAVLMLVVGAIKLKASQGNPVSQQNAKLTIAGAIGGLLLALFAPDIIKLITSAKG